MQTSYKVSVDINYVKILFRWAEEILMSNKFNRNGNIRRLPTLKFLPLVDNICL